MYADPIILIQEAAVLDFKSESPITVSGLKKTTCTVFARKGELLFLRTKDTKAILIKLTKFLLIAIGAVVYLYSDELDVDEDIIKIILYAGFGLYALLPRFLKTRKRELTTETLEKLAFEGELTRVSWREIIEVTEPKSGIRGLGSLLKGQSVFLKPGEFDMGYQTLVVSLNPNNFALAVAIASGEHVEEIAQEEP